MKEPRVVTVVYPNKAYWTKAYLNYLSVVKYEIFDCRGHSVADADVSTGDSRNAPGRITDKTLEHIQKFYESVGLIVPERNNFVPEYVEVGNNIIVHRTYEGLYNVGAASGFGTRTPSVDLVLSLPYEKALMKAQDIAALCDK